VIDSDNKVEKKIWVQTDFHKIFSEQMVDKWASHMYSSEIIQDGLNHTERELGESYTTQLWDTSPGKPDCNQSVRMSECRERE